MKKKIIPFITVFFLILVVILFMLLGKVIDKYTPSKEHQDLNEYYSLTVENDVAIVLNHQVIEDKARMIDGNVYLDIKTVKKYINERFYWDSNENILRYTTANDLITVNAESTDYTVTKDTHSMNHTIVKADAETAFVAVDFIKQYSDFAYEIYEEPERIVITNAWGNYTIASAKRNSEIRCKGGIKSPILKDIEKGAELTILETGETWTKVAASDGIMGYIKSKNLSSPSEKNVTSDFVAEEFSHIKKDFEINMVWHQVTNSGANSDIANVLQTTKGVNVISPTWFYLNSNSGSIASIASSSYVDYCHQNGVEVWALVDNFTNGEVSTKEVLTHTSSRDNLTNDIISAAIQYNLDGINMDFESLDPALEDSYIQFIRELSLKCANNGIVLSVDNYVPTDYTAFYDRAEQAVFADYVIIMGYDEHYSGSEEAGSVASIGFVTQGVEDTLKEVPAEQTILAMPFYTRVWELTPEAGESTETDETASDSYINYSLSCRSIGMGETQRLIDANGAEPIWLDDAGQYYAEYENNGSIYQIWVEDAVSLEEKLKVMDSYGLAGGAFWKLGLETSNIWDTIIKYIN